MKTWIDWSTGKRLVYLEWTCRKCKQPVTVSGPLRCEAELQMQLARAHHVCQPQAAIDEMNALVASNQKSTRLVMQLMDERTTNLAHIEQLTLERNVLLGALEVVEFAGWDCPWCGGRLGHAWDCQRQAALRQARGGA